MTVQANVDQWEQNNAPVTGSFTASGVSTTNSDVGGTTVGLITSTFAQDYKQVHADAVYESAAGQILGGGADTYVDFVPANGHVSFSIDALNLPPGVAKTVVYASLSNLSLLGPTPTPASTPTTAVASTPAPPAGKSVVLYECPSAGKAGNPVIQPTSYRTACATGQAYLQGLVWTLWGTPTAYATGSYLVDNCNPNCAQGQPVQYPATATASNIVGGAYSRLTINAPGAPGGPILNFTVTTEGPLG